MPEERVAKGLRNFIFLKHNRNRKNAREIIEAKEAFTEYKTRAGKKIIHFNISSL